MPKEEPAKRLAAPQPRPAMSAADLRAWMDSRQLSLRAAQAELGIGSRNSLLKYLEEGAPLTVALACSAVSAGLGPWKRQPD